MPYYHQSMVTGIYKKSKIQTYQGEFKHHTHICGDLFDQFVKNKLKAKNYIRYADDFVVLFEVENDAKAFYCTMKTRLEKFNLEVAEEKTNLLTFSRYGNKDNGKFEFLGFELSWGTSRKGEPLVKKRTARVKLRGAIKRFQEWIKDSKSLGISNVLRSVHRKFTGHYNYYGIIGNCKSLNQYYYVCRRLLFKWLNRRSQRRSYTWHGFDEVSKMFKIPAPKITQRKKKENKQQMLPGF